MEHLSEEWVDGVAPEGLEEGMLLAILILGAIHLGYELDLCDAELSHELIEGHDFVHTDIAELSFHNAVEHLVEVDETVVHIDAHLEDDSLDFSLICSL